MQRLKVCHHLALEPETSFAIASVQARVDDDAPLSALRDAGSDDLTQVWITSFKYYSLRVMTRASSSRNLTRIEVALPLEFANWRDAYAQAHDSALANDRTIRLEVWKLSWSMADIRGAAVSERRQLFAWDTACRCKRPKTNRRRRRQCPGAPA
eukprot:15467345-Alexandrium_andersonii.AAC.1